VENAHAAKFHENPQHLWLFVVYFGLM